MASRRWVVRAGDGPDLGAILARLAPSDRGAIGEGRVFVGRARASRADQRVKPGDEVVVHPRRAEAPSGEVEIALDRGGLVAALKPAGLPTIADHRGSDALVARVARALGCRPDELHPTSRLDTGVSGVVLLARTAEARERLSRARDEGAYRRRYLAVAARAPEPAEGRWEAPIGRASDPRLRAVNGREATHAATRYRLVAAAPSGEALLSLEPETGRTHQLRVHASHAGLPLLGDADYGGPARVALPGGKVLRLSRVALHCAWVEVPDERGGRLKIEAPVPDELASLWSSLGGAPEAWQKGAS